MSGLAVLGFIGYLLPAHSVEGGAWHSNFADGGVTALVVFAVFGGIAAFLRKRGLGAGILTGVLAVPAAIAAVAPVVLAHLLSHVESGPGEVMFGISIVGLFFGGLAFAIVEPLLYWTQRRVDERAAQTKLPSARVYA